MKKLSSLIIEANRTYGLGLDNTGVLDVHRRLKAAGYRDVVEATTETLDAVFTTADTLQRGPQAVYAAMRGVLGATKASGSWPWLGAGTPTTARAAQSRCR